MRQLRGKLLEGYSRTAPRWMSVNKNCAKVNVSQQFARECRMYSQSASYGSFVQVRATALQFDMRSVCVRLSLVGRVFELFHAKCERILVKLLL